MTTRIILFLLDLLRPVYTHLQVDYSQLRAIIETKLMMDGRRQTVRLSSKKTENNNVFFWTLVVYLVFGMFVSIGIFGTSFMLGITIFFAFLMVMISVTLITDFSSILLDTSDNSIILPRPVSSRTFYAARVTHILLYLGQLTFCLSIFPFIVVMFKYAVWLSIPFALGILLTVIFAVFITNGVYLIIMRFASEEKMKTIINYFQIAMTIFIMGGYQIGLRMLDKLEYADRVFEIKWWSYLIPPIWLSGMMETFYLKIFDASHLLLSGLSVLVPLGSIYVTNKWLTPFYNRKIAMMGNSQTVNESVKIKSQGSFVSNIGRTITSDPREEGAFHFAYKMLARDNKIKLKIYPGFGLIFVFGFIFLFKSKESISSVWANLPDTSYHILLIYLPFMVAQTAIYEIPFSDDFRASWIYYSAPLKKPGELLLGTAKAVFVQLFIPVYLVISLGILFIWKGVALDDIFFGLINNVLIFMILLNVVTRYLPLSIAPNARNQSGNLLRGLLMFVCTGVPAFGHYLLVNKPLILLAAIPFQLIAIYFLQRNYRNTTWSGVKF